MLEDRIPRLVYLPRFLYRPNWKGSFAPLHRCSSWLLQPRRSGEDTLTANSIAYSVSSARENGPEAQRCQGQGQLEDMGTTETQA